MNNFAHDIAVISRSLDLKDRRIAELEKRVAEQDEILAECLDYFENREDADCDERGYIANEEMRMAMRITGKDRP
jgi:hypothetical protein